MEVTKENFKLAFEKLRASIDKADFIAIDGEFTGLSTIKGRRISYDTLEQNYAKVIKGSSQFMLIQYGICLFLWNSENKNYEAMPFSFYIFPRPYKRFLNDVMFMCQSSSLNFLKNNHFDFNKLFYEGISFMSSWEQERAESRLKKEISFIENKAESTVSSEAIGDTTEKPKVFIPKDQREFVDKILTQVSDFIESEEKSLSLQPCNPFQRKLIYESLESKYPLGLYLESAVDDDNKKYIKVVKVTTAGLEIKNKEKYHQELKILDDVIGFSKVIKLLSESKKPIVGHNMYLDLFYTATNFFSQPLNDFKDYKLLLTSLFPTIIDTKLMSTTQPLANKLSGTTLKSLMESVEDEILPAPNVVYSKEIESHINEENQYHQAGYDAYCTGCSFISLSKCLLSGLKLPSNRIDISCDVLHPFVNRVNVMGIRDVQYMDISRPDKVPDRKCVFLVNFPKQWKDKDLENLFSPVCALSHPTAWLSETSAYVTLANESYYDEIIKTFVLGRKNSDLFCVMPYEQPLCYQSEVKEDEVKEEKKRLIKRKRVDSEVEDGELSSEEDEKVQKPETSEKDENVLKPEKNLFALPTVW